MQCHHIRNLSNKDYIFHGFLSAQQQKLGMIIFGSVFIKKSNQTEFKKKNRNRTETGSNRFGSGISVWLGFLGFLGFGLVFSGFGSVFFNVVRFSSGKTGSNQFGSGFPVWPGFLSFGSVFSGFGSVCFSVARLFRFGSVLAWFFFRVFSISVRFGFFLIKPKPNRTGRFFQNFNRFFFGSVFSVIFFRFSRFNRFFGFFAHP